ncbi:MAG: protein of unknown function DUF1624, partial [uncultured Sulfurovum sp.]
YHFTYDLNYFSIFSIDMNHNSIILILRYSIMSMFLLSVGMSLALTHQNTIKWSSIRKRMLQLGISALLISISTHIIFPSSWIYFGILHFILFASLITLPLLNFPKVTLILVFIIPLGSAMGLLHLHYFYEKLQIPIILPLHSEDLVPLFPWLAIVLLGTLIVHYNYHQKIFTHKIFDLNFPINKILKKMGQNSLLIYLIHQPILFTTFKLYFIFFSK